MIAETDEDLMMRYLEDEEISTDELRAALRAATIAGTLVPDARVELRSRTRASSGCWTRSSITCRRRATCRRCRELNPSTGEADIRTTDPDEPFSALAFKIVADPHVGRLAYRARLFRPDVDRVATF